MTKDVLVSINGVQFESNSDENIEVITVGEYSYKDNKHFINYEEVSEELVDVIKCTIKVDNDGVEIIKTGSINVHMIFNERKKNVTYYNTPYGDLLIGITATKIKVKELENSINVSISYSLEINNQHISNCDITMDIKSKEKASLQLKN